MAVKWELQHPPLASPAHTYGWMILSRTLAAGVFSADDERLAVMLAAQLALAYENACCFKAVQTAVRARDEFLSVAAQIGRRATVQLFRLDEANVALERVRAGTLKGAAVLATPGN